MFERFSSALSVVAATVIFFVIIPVPINLPGIIAFPFLSILYSSLLTFTLGQLRAGPSSLAAMLLHNGASFLRMVNDWAVLAAVAGDDAAALQAAKELVRVERR